MADAERVTDALAGAAPRERPLPHADFDLRTHRPGKSATFRKGCFAALKSLPQD
ncbi:hypothetical protein [Streptomyces sp. NBC_00162]|uniref:hypothetical protein n=1 Tax=Streptomyces sp. NBC_00162 TaxID=2903629 RepID=UPI00214C0EBE|nr:hypothetical protein [Streptomyces sp. NBC_00162]UUU42112.1 hypothetical protein JIW86_26840 [Streptomyces sp. NBC_00162]